MKGLIYRLSYDGHFVSVGFDLPLVFTMVSSSCSELSVALCCLTVVLADKLGRFTYGKAAVERLYSMVKSLRVFPPIRRVRCL